jgi:organic radical activating enzyme
MKVKRIMDEDFVNYRVPSMYIGFPHCSFKCGSNLCQNSSLARSKDIEFTYKEIVDRYKSNDITRAIVCAGLEPFDNFEWLINLVFEFRKETEDDIVIFTGYYKNEIQEEINELIKYKNIIIKYGRFIPNQEKHYDEILGIYLVSDNQYAEKIS